jgi:hypothetical protein
MSVPVEAIKCLGERLQFRLQDTLKYLDELKEIEEGLDALKKEIE